MISRRFSPLVVCLQALLLTPVLGCSAPPPFVPALPSPRLPPKVVPMPEAWNRWHPIEWDAPVAQLPEGARLPIPPASLVSYGGGTKTTEQLSVHAKELLAQRGLLLLGTGSRSASPSGEDASLGGALREPISRGAPIVLTADTVAVVAAAAVARALQEARARVVEAELPALFTRWSVALREEAKNTTPRIDGTPSALPQDLAGPMQFARIFVAVPRALLAPEVPLERDIESHVTAEIARLRGRTVLAPSIFGGAPIAWEALPAATVPPNLANPAAAVAWLSAIHLEVRAVGEGGTLSVAEARRNARIALLLLRALRRDPEVQKALVRCDHVFAFSEGERTAPGLLELLAAADAEGLLSDTVSQLKDVVLVDRYRHRLLGIAPKFSLFPDRSLFDNAAISILAPRSKDVASTLPFTTALVANQPAARRAFGPNDSVMGALMAQAPAEGADSRHASAWGSWLSTSLAAAAMPESLVAQPFSGSPGYAARRADAASVTWLAGRIAGRLIPPAFEPLRPASTEPVVPARLVVVEPDPATFVSIAATLGQVRESLASALPEGGRDPELFMALAELERVTATIAQGSIATTGGVAILGERHDELLEAPWRLARLADQLGVDRLLRERVSLYRDRVADRMYLARIDGPEKLVVVTWDAVAQKAIVAEGAVFVPSSAELRTGEASFRRSELAKEYAE